MDTFNLFPIQICRSSHKLLPSLSLGDIRGQIGLRMFELIFSKVRL